MLRAAALPGGTVGHKPGKIRVIRHTIGSRIATPLFAQLFALLFAASLAFGVSSSFAQARAEGDCLDDGWSINAGPCTNPEFCDLKCQGRWFEGGDCISGTGGNCCVCRA